MVKMSIVIPYYKTYELTVKLLDVLVPQLTNEVEVYLVDDGCKEERLDVYKDKIKIIHLDENVGATSAMNIAIKKMRGKYVGIIDSDDMIAEDYVETLLKAINERDEDTIFFEWQDMSNGEIIKHPNNYAPWKAIYRKTIMPNFRDGWRYSYDVPFQEDLAKIKTTRYDIEKVLYFYNRLREGNLTSLKEKFRRKEMIKCEVIEKFTLSKFDELKNIKRKSVDEKGMLYVGDTFECTTEMAKYLTGENALNKKVVKVIEVEPEKEEVKEEIVEEKIDKKEKKSYNKAPKKRSKKEM